MAASLDIPGSSSLLEKKRQQWAEERDARQEWFPFGRPGAGAPLTSAAERVARQRASFRKTVEFINNQNSQAHQHASSQSQAAHNTTTDCSQGPSTSAQPSSTANSVGQLYNVPHQHAPTSGTVSYQPHPSAPSGHLPSYPPYGGVQHNTPYPGGVPLGTVTYAGQGGVVSYHGGAVSYVGQQGTVSYPGQGAPSGTVSYPGPGGPMALPPNSGPVVIPVQPFGANGVAAAAGTPGSTGSLPAPPDELLQHTTGQLPHHHEVAGGTAPSVVHSTGGNPSSGDGPSLPHVPTPLLHMPPYPYPYYPYPMPCYGGVPGPPTVMSGGSYPPHNMPPGGGYPGHPAMGPTPPPMVPPGTVPVSVPPRPDSYTEQWANQLHVWSNVEDAPSGGGEQHSGKHPTAPRGSQSRSLGTTGYVETAPSLNSDGIGLLTADTLHRRRNLITSGKDPGSDPVDQEFRELERRAIIEEQIAVKKAQENAAATREEFEQAKIDAERERIEQRQENEDGQELSKWKKLRAKEESRATAVLDAMRQAEEEAKAIRHARLHRHASQGRSRNRSEPPDRLALDLSLATDDAMSISTPTEALAAAALQTSGIESSVADEQEEAPTSPPASQSERTTAHDLEDTSASTASVIHDYDQDGESPRSRMARSQSVPSGPSPYLESPGDERPIKPQVEDPLAVWEQMVREGTVPRPPATGQTGRGDHTPHRGSKGRTSLRLPREEAVKKSQSAARTKRNRSLERHKNDETSKSGKSPTRNRQNLANGHFPTTNVQNPATPQPYKRTTSDLTQPGRRPEQRREPSPFRAPGRRTQTAQSRSRSRSRSPGSKTGAGPSTRPAGPVPNRSDRTRQPSGSSPVRKPQNVGTSRNIRDEKAGGARPLRPSSKSPARRATPSPSPPRKGKNAEYDKKMSDSGNSLPKNGLERNVALRGFSPGRRPANLVPNGQQLPPAGYELPNSRSQKQKSKSPSRSSGGKEPQNFNRSGAIPPIGKILIRRHSVDKPVSAFLYPEEKSLQNRESRSREPRKTEHPDLKRSQLLPNPVLPFEFDGKNPLYQPIQTRRLRKPGQQPKDQFDLNPGKFDLMTSRDRLTSHRPPPDPEPRSESLISQEFDKPPRQHTWNSHIDAPGRRSYFDAVPSSGFLPDGSQNNNGSIVAKLAKSNRRNSEPEPENGHNDVGSYAGHKWNKMGLERTYDVVPDDDTPYPSSGISSLRTTQDSDVLTQYTLPGQGPGMSRRSFRRSLSRGASPQRRSIMEQQREILAKMEAVRMELKSGQKQLVEGLRLQQKAEKKS